jgi:hypothetical protein
MRRSLALTVALLVFSGSGLAAAAGPAQLAETAGFLLGNAHRCGVSTERVGDAGKVIHDLIVAASDDATEEEAADRRFAEIFIASAYPDRTASLVAPCEAVIAQFERLERHHRQSGMN